MSSYQFSKKIERTLEEYVRPQLQRDGRDAEIVDIKGTIIYLKLTGACAGCAHAGQTMKLMIERTLKELVDEKTRVVAV